ncbi:hypothetical protein MID07_10900 [Acinetobacter seifertii]|uniref:hypothetical protein n=1 Tax=Acinetobacter seifertii TaxID=1530123 RepID=UPI001F021C23|nr:hypothetical protein [Acinetobacter seifertii]MCG8285124.1 hypothetical protein [Acinetobacter seifertii]
MDYYHQLNPHFLSVAFRENAQINLKINTVEETFVSPEAFGAKANNPNFDNSNALNAAFATGKDVYSTPDKTYYVTKNLRTKGQRLIGGWKIHSRKSTSRVGVWEKTVSTVDEPEVNTKIIKMLYVATAYDLSEFLYIKSLGFNVLQHYSGMHIQGWDNDGNVQNMLDNAKSAGLKVIVGTQNDPGARANLVSWVKSIDSHPAIIGYSVFDEPVHNGISVKEQNEKIALLRSITNKLLTTVEFTVDPLKKRLSNNYDIIFLDVYNDSNADFKNEDATQKDLHKMQETFDLYKKQYHARIIPVVMGFKYVNGAPLNRIVKTSKLFSKVSSGSLGVFIWDGDAEPSIETSVRNSPQLENMSKEINTFKNLKMPPHKTLLKDNFIEIDKKKYRFKGVSKYQLPKNLYSINMFEEINSFQSQILDKFSGNFQFFPSNIIWKALLSLWFKGIYGAYVSNIIIHKYNDFISCLLMIQPNTVSLKVLLDKSLKYYSLENNNVKSYSFRYTNNFLVDFLFIE